MSKTPVSSSSANPGSNSSLETPRTSVSAESPRSQRYDISWEDLLKVNINTYTVFKKVLLRTLTWDGASGYPLNRHHLDDDVPVMVYNGKTYYLRPDNTVLIHDAPPSQKEANTFYKQFHFGEERPTPFISTDHATQGNGDFFLPLGSLVEAANDGGEKRLTNYCWALNISTDPVSVWLVYEYVTTDFLGDEITVQLSDIYLNQGNEWKEFPYTFDRLPPAQAYLGLDSAWDVLKVFDDVEKDWQPQNAQAAKLDSPERRYNLGPTLRAYALELPPKSP
ncbi:MAG: hypothetical protein Q9208_006829 [Pyrenodesmia sp. 3 TL-2023]